MIVSKTLQSLSSLFARRDINGPFISSLGRDVFNVIRPLVTGDDVMTKVKEISEEQLPVVQEALKALEVLVTVADDKRTRRIHEFAMQRLNAVAPTWPTEFKQVLACHPTLKKRLENALLFQSNRQMQAQQVAKAKAVAAESKILL
ncbi:unnamed protein product [Strongylus vulgaris]|uniref:Uncharacterized protein n=1 Tax=Strongylus vulgaris TaxID=40348 RepID=A0A3P7LMQ5_STRVU|nr:unnamed protein product [Strongylus vulgaris]